MMQSRNKTGARRQAGWKGCDKVGRSALFWKLKHPRKGLSSPRRDDAELVVVLAGTLLQPLRQICTQDDCHMRLQNHFSLPAWTPRPALCSPSAVAPPPQAERREG